MERSRPFRCRFGGRAQGHVLELVGRVCAIVVGKLAGNKSNRVVTNFGLSKNLHFSTAVLGVVNVKSLHVKIGFSLFLPVKVKQKIEFAALSPNSQYFCLQLNKKQLTFQRLLS